MRPRQHFCAVSVVALTAVLLATAACGSGSNQAGVAFPFLPVELQLRDDGSIALAGKASLATPLGTFSLSHSIPLRPKKSTGILVVVHHRDASGAVVNSVYEVDSRGEEIVVVVDGRTVISIRDKRVKIDAVAARVESILIRPEHQTEADLDVDSRPQDDSSVAEPSATTTTESATTTPPLPETAEEAGEVFGVSDAVAHYRRVGDYGWVTTEPVRLQLYSGLCVDFDLNADPQLVLLGDVAWVDVNTEMHRALMSGDGSITGGATVYWSACNRL